MAGARTVTSIPVSVLAQTNLCHLSTLSQSSIHCSLFQWLLVFSMYRCQWSVCICVHVLCVLIVCIMVNVSSHAVEFIHFASAFAATSCSHVTAPSSAEWRRNRSPSANLVSGQDSTMWIIVCTSPHWHLSVGAM